MTQARKNVRMARPETTPKPMRAHRRPAARNPLYRPWFAASTAEDSATSLVIWKVRSPNGLRHKKISSTRKTTCSAATTKTTTAARTVNTWMVRHRGESVAAGVREAQKPAGRHRHHTVRGRHQGRVGSCRRVNLYPPVTGNQPPREAQGRGEARRPECPLGRDRNAADPEPGQPLVVRALLDARE